MTDRDYGPPWQPQQGYGQHFPQGQPQQPRNNPHDHGQRRRGQPSPQDQRQQQQNYAQQYPQGQPWQPQPYDQGQYRQRWQQPPAQYQAPGYGQVQPYALRSRLTRATRRTPHRGMRPAVAPKSTAAGLILGLHMARRRLHVCRPRRDRHPAHGNLAGLDPADLRLRNRLPHRLRDVDCVRNTRLHDDARVEHRPRHCVLIR